MPKGKDEALTFEEVLKSEDDAIGSPGPRAALCLSGGGIRSAIFSLGVLQVLAQAGVLGYFDYLSTVSGGGYIGAWMTAWIRRSAGGLNEVSKGLMDEHAPPFNYLRANSQYLRSGPSSASPGTGALLGLYGQKTALTLFLILPVLVGLVLLPRLSLIPLGLFTLPAVFVAGVVFAAYVQVFAAARSVRPTRLRGFRLAWYAVPETVCALISIRLAAEPPMTALFCYAGAAALAFVILRAHWSVLPSLIASTGAQLAGVYLLARVSDSQNALSLALAALLLRVVVNAVFCGLLGYFDREAEVTWAAVARAWLVNLVLLLIVMEAFGVWLPGLFMGLRLELKVLIAFAVVAAAAIFVALVYRSVEINPRDKRSGKLPPPLGALFHLAAVVTVAGLLGAVGAWFNACSRGWEPLQYIVLPLILAPLAAGFFVDANRLSLHRMYRDSLVRAFLGASRNRDPDPFTGLDPDDDMPLAGDAQRPFPVICAARKNIGPLSDTPFQRTTESFTFTPLHCGTANLGYRPTGEYAGGIRLGSAVATSGAAVSPNLTEGSGHIALLRTILNPHLGVWLPNPARRWWRNTRPLLAQTALIKDLIGAGRATDGFIYVSDGGHFENLGLYEMVRRRCKYIVVVDAGRDIMLTGDDLANAIARVRMDLDVVIEIDRPRGSHFSVGRIGYRDETGVLVYIKPVMTGDEPLEVVNYRELNIEFPQESTADQFFTEAQFESYRLLGQHSLAAVRGSYGGSTIEAFVGALIDAAAGIQARPSF